MTVDHRRLDDRRTDRADRRRASPARPASSTTSLAIAGRALRAVPARPRGGHPAGVHRALLLRREHRARWRTSPRATSPGFDYTAFQMPTAILLGVTGVSRAPALVLDVQNGYFDRLLLTPVRRLAILLGHMVADVAVAAGADRADPRRSGSPSACASRPAPLGVAGVRRCIAALWSLAFAGFGYAIALKTGNPAAVNSSFLLFFPFLFLTSSYVPRDQLTRLARHRRRAGTRSPTCSRACARWRSRGWHWDDLGKAFLAAAGGVPRQLRRSASPPCGPG